MAFLPPVLGRRSADHVARRHAITAADGRGTGDQGAGELLRRATHLVGVARVGDLASRQLEVDSLVHADVVDHSVLLRHLRERAHGPGLLGVGQGDLRLLHSVVVGSKDQRDLLGAVDLDSDLGRGAGVFLRVDLQLGGLGGLRGERRGLGVERRGLGSCAEAGERNERNESGMQFHDVVLDQNEGFSTQSKEQINARSVEVFFILRGCGFRASLRNPIIFVL